MHAAKAFVQKAWETTWLWPPQMTGSSWAPKCAKSESKQEFITKESRDLPPKKASSAHRSSGAGQLQDATNTTKTTKTTKTTNTQ